MKKKKDYQYLDMEEEEKKRKMIKRRDFQYLEKVQKKK
jgi:hypothetical protein